MPLLRNKEVLTTSERGIMLYVMNPSSRIPNIHIYELCRTRASVIKS